MNETQLIRRQLEAERTHLIAVAVAAADPAAPGAQREAAAAYGRCVLGWFEARDARLGELATRLGAQDARCSAFAEILAREGSSTEALRLLGGSGGQALPHFLCGPWRARREAIEALLASDARAADWRTITGIDADSILAERALFARVAAALPAGASLTAATRAA